MPSFHDDAVVVREFIRPLRGGSQPALVRGNDGFLYIAKFANNPQGRNVLFNDSIGTELYRAAGLEVPDWKPLRVSAEFLDQNPECHIDQEGGTIVPETGLCFGSRFLGGTGDRICEVLPGSSFNRIQNRSDFWLAWLIDTCAEHTDTRQAIFRGNRRLTAVFIDHGSLFGGPTGTETSTPAASRHLDARVYENGTRTTRFELLSRIAAIEIDPILKAVDSLPDAWKSKAALERISQCLTRLSDSTFLRKAVWAMEDHLDSRVYNAVPRFEPAYRCAIDACERQFVPA